MNPEFFFHVIFYRIINYLHLSPWMDFHYLSEMYFISNVLMDILLPRIVHWYRVTSDKELKNCFLYMFSFENAFPVVCLINSPSVLREFLRCSSSLKTFSTHCLVGIHVSMPTLSFPMTAVTKCHGLVGLNS